MIVLFFLLGIIIATVGAAITVRRVDNEIGVDWDPFNEDKEKPNIGL
ncbi:MAG: hypothetical protein MUC49_15675 [Raineya sp.]|jgi:hypothetical protein|nr:hypothetical protein [Raineya sp.]